MLDDTGNEPDPSGVPPSTAIQLSTAGAPRANRLMARPAAAGLVLMARPAAAGLGQES